MNKYTNNFWFDLLNPEFYVCNFISDFEKERKKLKQASVWKLFSPKRKETVNIMHPHIYFFNLRLDFKNGLYIFNDGTGRLNVYPDPKRVIRSSTVKEIPNQGFYEQICVRYNNITDELFLHSIEKSRKLHLTKKNLELFV